MVKELIIYLKDFPQSKVIFPLELPLEFKASHPDKFTIVQSFCGTLSDNDQILVLQQAVFTFILQMAFTQLLLTQELLSFR